MTNCSYCQSQDIIRRGFNYSKDYRIQKYSCKDCNKFFSYKDRLPKNHVSSEIVGLCFDLYLKGLSYRVIRQQILEKFEIKVSHVTIYYWIQQYTGMMKKYVDSLQPEVSVVWQMDETMIPFKGRGLIAKDNRMIKGGKWCWVCIDTVTRFAIDMYLANSVGTNDGMRFFKRIKNIIAVQPEVISTDGNNTYIGCIREYYPAAHHFNIKKISIKPNTSFVERFNGTIKNRTKTMRCFEEFYPCQTTLTAFQIYYNFLRPHMSLDGRTPAQAAGIDIEFPDRWVSLIRAALLSS